MITSTHAQLETDKTRLVEYLTRQENAVSQKTLREHLGLSGEQFSAALRDLLEQNRVDIFRGSGSNELMVSLSTKGLSDNFARVLQEIRRSGSSGIDQAGLIEALRMPRTEITKALRALVSQRYIQERRSFTNRAKKVYLLFNLEPSTQVTGGSLYCGEELDVHLVDSLRSLIASFVYKKGVASLFEIQQFMRSFTTNAPYPTIPSHPSFSTSSSSSSSPSSGVSSGFHSPANLTAGSGSSSPAWGSTRMRWNAEEAFSSLQDSSDTQGGRAGRPPPLMESASGTPRLGSPRRRSESGTTALRDICSSPISIVASPTGFSSPGLFREGSMGGERGNPFSHTSPSFSPQALMSLQEYQQQRQQEFLSSAAKAVTSKEVTSREISILVRTLVLDGVLDESYEGPNPAAPHPALFAGDGPYRRGKPSGGWEETTHLDPYEGSRSPEEGGSLPSSMANSPRANGLSPHHHWQYSMAVGKNALRHFSAVPRLSVRRGATAPSSLVELEETAIRTFLAASKRSREAHELWMSEEGGEDHLQQRKREWLDHLVWHAVVQKGLMVPSPLSENTRVQWATEGEVEEGGDPQDEHREDERRREGRNGFDDGPSGESNLMEGLPHPHSGHRFPVGRLRMAGKESCEQGAEPDSGIGDNTEWSYMGAIGYPCLGCPLLSSCHPEGVINPTDCVYLQEWMA